MVNSILQYLAMMHQRGGSEEKPITKTIKNNLLKFQIFLLWSASQLLADVIAHTSTSSNNYLAQYDDKVVHTNDDVIKSITNKNI